MQSEQPVAAKKRAPQKPRSYGDEAIRKTRTTAAPRAATAATASSTGKKSIKERIKSAIKSVKATILGNKKGKSKLSKLEEAVDEAVKKDLEELEEKVLADVDNIEKDYPNKSKVEDEKDEFITKIDKTVKDFVININKVLEFTEHTRVFFSQDNAPEVRKEKSPEKVSEQVAKRALTKEEQENILFEKVNIFIEVLAAQLVDNNGKKMLIFNKNKETPTKYTLTITGLGVDIKYTSLNELLKIVSGRIEPIIFLCRFFGCSDNVKSGLKQFKKTYNKIPIDTKELYFNFLDIVNAYISNNNTIYYKIDDQTISPQIPKELSTLLNDKTVGGKKHKRKPKKAAATAATAAKAAKAAKKRKLLNP